MDLTVVTMTKQKLADAQRTRKYDALNIFDSYALH